MTTVLTWNIWHGGGKRVKRIAEAVFKHNPDIIILTEFRYGRTGEQIIELLKSGGLVYQTFASTTPRMNSVLVASRLPFEAQLATGDLLDNEQRCIKAVFSKFTLFAFYFPLLTLE